MSERMWCTACGTVTAVLICDCNRYGTAHEMYREPHFINYADAMQKAAHEQAQESARLRTALEDIADPELVKTTGANGKLSTIATMQGIARAELGPLRPAGSADLYGVPRAEEDGPEPVEEPTPPQT